MMPEGVEHWSSRWVELAKFLIQFPMMPKGDFDSQGELK
jgi:hypothetical protein